MIEKKQSQTRGDSDGFSGSYFPFSFCAQEQRLSLGFS